jgi:hypothetical protein
MPITEAEIRLIILSMAKPHIVGAVGEPTIAAVLTKLIVRVIVVLNCQY